MSVVVMLVPALSVLICILYLQYRWRYRRMLSAASKLPCPPALPFVGNAMLFIGGVSSLTKNIIRLTTQFKELFCIWVGPVPVFVVSNPADVQIVLNSSNTLEKDDVYKFLKPFIGNGILTGPVPMWKKYRRLISPMLHPTNVETFLPVFNDVSRQLVDRFDDARNIDPRFSIYNTAVDAAMRTLMAREVTLDDKTKKTIHYLFDEVGRMFLNRLFKVWLHVDWVYNLLYRKEVDQSLRGIASCKQVFQQRIQENWEERTIGLKSSGDPEQQDEPEKNFAYLSYVIPEDETEDHTWWDEVSTMLVAATDTAVSSMSFFLLSIANHPHIQDKVRKEIRTVMGDSGRDVTVEDLQALTYLSQVMMESMRLHGVFPVIIRKATKDTKLSKATIPAGSRVIVPLHAMGWDSDIFPNPNSFLPDRFSPENASGRHKYAFLPFSGGPRNCLGKKYGINLMKTVMVHILQRFEVRTNVRLEDIEYEMKIVMFSKTPIPLEFIPL